MVRFHKPVSIKLGCLTQEFVLRNLLGIMFNTCCVSFSLQEQRGRHQFFDNLVNIKVSLKGKKKCTVL